jgi:hypothetical protein
MEKERIHLGNRLIIIATGIRSQTVNLCTPPNVEGVYEQRYRSDDSRFWVTGVALQRAIFSVDQLHDHLVGRSFVPQGPHGHA